VPGWNKHQQSPLSAGSFSELLLRDDLARPGHGIEDRFKAVGRGPSRSQEASATSPGFPRPSHGGSLPLDHGVIR
jgi:hypothetical protein